MSFFWAGRSCHTAKKNGVLGIMQTTVFHNLDSKMHRNLVMAHIYIMISMCFRFYVM